MTIAARCWPIALGGMLLAASPALACPPPPPIPQFPGETPEAYETRLKAIAEAGKREYEKFLLEKQTGNWAKARIILIARILRTQPDSDSQRVWLRPVKWLKGAKPAETFKLEHTTMTSCGNFGGGDAPGGEKGDLFVIYAKAAPLGAATLIDAVSPANLRDPQVQALLPPR